MGTVIGFIGTALTVLQFALGNYGQSSSDTLVSLGIGFATNPDTGAYEGPVPIGGRGSGISVIGFNEQGDESFSAAGSGSIDAGATIFLDGDAGGQDSPYLQLGFFSNDISVCLAWMAVTYPSGNQYSIMAGDIFQYCNVGQNPVEWYYSAKDAGTFQDDTSRPYYPQCAWLSFNKDGGHRYSGLMARLPDYAASNINAGQALCRPPVLSIFTDNLAIGCPPDNLDCTTEPLRTRAINDNTGAGPKNDTSLVVTNAWSHNATELCNSPSSRGPDLVSLSEGVHCDMQTRILTPLCAETGKGEPGCFQVDFEKKLGKRGLGRFSNVKRYSAIHDWRK